ncbi:hypothetical protein PIB30_001025 [Stylosanthes scabra]|uniref:Uncharacterized protein n=1 Tax=Stylosanthes scabra TaxID=79078 RepID=A0ABU6T3I3_9FABA|nr:hypothetical protein [Stylosanthes scabra]
MALLLTNANTTLKSDSAANGRFFRCSTADSTKSASETTPNESAAYKEWRQNDLALQTWLAASITKPYQNKISHLKPEITDERGQEDSDDDYIQNLIDGLTEEYYGFTAFVMGRFGTITVPEVEAFLIAYDEMLH